MADEAGKHKRWYQRLHASREKDSGVADQILTISHKTIFPVSTADEWTPGSQEDRTWMDSFSVLSHYWGAEVRAGSERKPWKHLCFWELSQTYSLFSCLRQWMWRRNSDTFPITAATLPTCCRAMEKTGRGQETNLLPPRWLTPAMPPPQPQHVWPGYATQASRCGRWAVYFIDQKLKLIYS